MTRMHGKDIRLYLGSRDASGDCSGVSVDAIAATHDVTVFQNSDYLSFDPGLLSWEGSLDAFYDPTAGGIGRQLEAIGDGTAGLGVLSIYDAKAAAVGALGILGGEALFTKRGQPMKVSDMVKLSGTLRGVGRLGVSGVLLHVLGARTTSSQGTAVDNAAASSNGGRGNLHVTAATGSGTIKVQHSADNSSWSDLITFTAATGATSQSVEVSGTIKRYTRASWAPGTSITFVCGLARY